jgi:hypothetical protein
MTNSNSFAAIERATSEYETLLVEFATSLQKHTFYPSGHPIVVASADRLHARLCDALDACGSLAVGVARQQLVVDGVPLGDDHPILRDLAALLHRQQLAAMVLHRGVERDELSEVLTTLGTEALQDSDNEQVSDLLALEGRWPHVLFTRQSFDRLQMGFDDGSADDADEARVNDLWLGLARVALAGGRDETGGRIDDAAQLAAALHAQIAAGEETSVAGYVQRLAAELDHAGERRHVAVRAQLSALLGTLNHESLERLLHMGGDAGKRAEFVRHAASILAAPAVVDLLRSASSAAGRGISDSLLRLLGKLAHYAQRGAEGFDLELRDHVRETVTKWTQDDPNPDEYNAALTTLAHSNSEADDDRGRSRLEPDRLIEIALHVGEGGPSLVRAARALAARGDWTEILLEVEAAPPSHARDLLLQELVTPRQLSRVLPRLPKSRDVAERLVMRLGPGAVTPLIDALSDPGVKDSATCVALLGRLGVAAVPGIANRIQGVRPQIQAQLLSVLADTGVLPGSIDVWELARHSMSSVRREALRLLLSVDEHREKAVATAMQDSDPRILRDGLRAAPKPMPAALAHLVMQRVDRQGAGLALEERVVAIQVLATCQIPAVRDWLARSVVRKRMFGGFKLADPSADVLTALRALAAVWGADPAVAPILSLATAHKDGEFRAAVRAA